ncbi:16S rRNA (adenine(1518)-N(6)/adenine(1519)-N(6))-dimethyltransferase RsmA [Candidatus Pelagibacter sp.]|uniref:16S rRNA (adenine(1518)-N(6)/adenine(1519)-N(6))- dimethyltransferase RsmA n=1 Tax=uncultured Candidatus Pelagibacter sp. TaxID=372654 RepID=UPI00233E0C6A|nr:16S rRNA (adenine(1518)-N(6)/adenine(1519)-N(6))-dimethyltransferase RsmA [uncultured Candidatus Pelagibacter sp.]MDB4812070.1 16S rRNA (adenine(1518)-N(6)/adenine(1519)-N(6))-dimethyltransferase RsmA [Candidatus Pelagibacter sp.]MDC0465148.1 16S rRNA (adenine(1518)-N(6)/adenine(1519)-N(6))-dimethyltransferase RsmA [Candidatus Pelagibacter sp.]MDC1077561.1 16S rRNA (adenine(1518)-N(6)/adenine(1519)-N(6))-dimethyltransferase RsmA [Candidatus Pelagibacter sp.]
MIRAKKSLGQNFLIDSDIISKIVNTVSITDNEILEVGPGTGNLTKEILKNNPSKMYLVEKDNFLAESLKEIIDERVIIFNEDILKFDTSSLSKNKIVVFGNLPYNISTEILSTWIVNLKKNYWFSDLILMFQKEVADRIIAQFNTSAYGRLSILANWRLNINKICDIAPESFSPRPKIQSTLIHFTPKKNFADIKDPLNLEKITRVFFSHRRKMLKKPFNQIFNGNNDLLNKFNLDLNLRPQNLDFDTYYKLTIEYEKLRS